MFVITDEGIRINLHYVENWCIIGRTIYFEIDNKTHKKSFEHSSDSELFAQYLDELETIEVETDCTDAFYHLLNQPLNLN